MSTSKVTFYLSEYDKEYVVNLITRRAKLIELAKGDGSLAGSVIFMSSLLGNVLLGNSLKVKVNGKVIKKKGRHYQLTE